jgi:carboxypeptidase C (cathepsin A)
MKFLRHLCTALALLALAAPSASAQRGRDGAAPAAAEQKSTGAGVLGLLPADSVTEHSLNIGGETLAYTATAGTFPLYDQNGERSAAIFYTAYTRKGPAAEARPLTFAFNGGPGASSAYLHLGLVGPRVIEFGPTPDGVAPALRDNPDTWLKFTDLVLIDPVGTGWSRAAKPDGAGQFWSVRADAQALAKVIALYVARNNRTASPKYILGESYGGFRAAKVARAMQQEQGIVASGIVMLSPLLEGSFQFGGNRFALGAALHLPSLAAAEMDRRKAFSADELAKVERFALTDYLATLAGPAPQGEPARRFYARVAELTGLPVDVVTRTRGFVRDAYVKNVLERQSQVVSPYDAAHAAPDPFPESESEEGADPILDGYLQALGGAFVGYARDELGFKTEMTFMLLNREVSGKWEWGEGRRSQPSVTRDIRELLALNPGFRLLIAHGRSDLVTPYGVSRYVLDHIPPIGPPERAQLKIYKGGHMFYLDPQPRAAFSADAAAFYRTPGL